MRILTLLFSLYLLLSQHAVSQKIYTELDYTNFREHASFNMAIDINKFDSLLLNACIFFATNEIRVKKRLTPLEYNSALEASSMLHAEDMATLNFFSHTNNKNKKHRDPEDRAIAVGISNPHVAENIIEGFVIQYKSGMDVIAEKPGEFVNPKTHDTLNLHSYLSLTDNILNQWMHSEGHRKNILAKDALELGCGVSLYYMPDFNMMPTVKAVQSFQWFEKVILK